jgi:hypothetical protein
MSRFSQQKFLEETLSLLIAHFGVDSVRSTFNKLAPPRSPSSNNSSSENEDNQSSTSRPRVDLIIDELKNTDPERAALLDGFRKNLIDRKLLIDTEDLRQFAISIGLKEITGRSRREMITNLMHFMLAVPANILPEYINNSGGISEESRRKGFSILTDKLMED